MNETALRLVNGHRTLDGDDGEGGGEDPRLPCPVCAATEPVVRAASIVRAGRFRFRTADGRIGECETELARLLSRPPEPRAMPLLDLLVALALSWLILAADLLIVESLRLQDVVDIPAISLDIAFWLGLAWFGFLIPALTAARFIDSNLRLRAELPRWREALDRWRGLYYCTFDDVVFDQDGEAPLPPERAAQLWRPGDGAIGADA